MQGPEASMANDHIKVQSRNVQSPLSVGSNEVPAIPAVDPLADRRSDGGGDRGRAPPIAPLAQSSRRSFLVNSIVSGVSLASATAIPSPSLAAAGNLSPQEAAATNPDDFDKAAMVVRAEELVGIFCTFEKAGMRTSIRLARLNSWRLWAVSTSPLRMRSTKGRSSPGLKITA
jgi:hypothetical protein